MISKFFFAGENFKNLSPRKGQLLKSLQEKLKLNETSVNCLPEKLNKRSDGENMGSRGKYPEVLLVRQIGANSVPGKKTPSQVRSVRFLTVRRPKLVRKIFESFQIGYVAPAVASVGSRSPSNFSSKTLSKNPEKLREYYCEDCLATMRIFEDSNPSVKNMVDKFETIIRLESY